MTRLPHTCLSTSFHQLLLSEFMNRDMVARMGVMNLLSNMGFAQGDLDFPKLGIHLQYPVLYPALDLRSSHVAGSPRHCFLHPVLSPCLHTSGVCLVSPLPNL